MTLVAAGGTFNVETATCGVTCITCSGYSNPAVTPNPVLCPVGDSMQLTFEATDSNGDVVSLPANWASSDTTVMTVGETTGIVTGLEAGTPTITAQSSTPIIVNTGTICSSVDPSCQYAQPSAGANAETMDFSIWLDNRNVDCTGQTESYQKFQATPSSTNLNISASGSSCKVTGTTGNIDLDAKNPTSFSVVTGIGECQVNFYAGPAQSNGYAGTITVQITAAFAEGPGTVTHSFTGNIACGSSP